MSEFYIKGKGYEIIPNVFVEYCTKIYPKNTLRGKMQWIAFYWASIYVNSVTNLDASIELLKKISCSDSQLYYPASFGLINTQEGIELDVRGFAAADPKSSVWFPKNGWAFDNELKCGVIGSNNKKCRYYNFSVEVQFRQTNKAGVSAVTNDNWSIFLNKNLSKFYQIKEWLDGRVRRLQAEIVTTGTPTLIYDYNNVNVIPWPPVTPGKENCINPVTVKSGCVS